MSRSLANRTARKLARSVPPMCDGNADAYAQFEQHVLQLLAAGQAATGELLAGPSSYDY
jgi:hypothetical protein